MSAFTDAMLEPTTANLSPAEYARMIGVSKVAQELLPVWVELDQEHAVAGFYLQIIGTLHAHHVPDTEQNRNEVAALLMCFDEKLLAEPESLEPADRKKAAARQRMFLRNGADS